MSNRTLKSRLLFDISDVRKELTKEVQELKPEELDYVPREGVKMKSIRAILEEVGAMEAVSVHMITDGNELDWGEALSTMAMANVDPQGALQALAPIRAKIALVGEQVFGRQDRSQAQVQAGLAAQARRRGRDLIEQGGADLARADQADRDRLRRQPECRVCGAQRERGLVVGNRDRDVAL